MAVPTPTLDKMQSVHVESQAIGEFLEWLQGEKHITLCEPHKHNEEDENPDDPEGCKMGFRTYQCGFTAGQFLPANLGGIERLLAEYFEIDLKAADKEKCALLDDLRAMHNKDGAA